MRIILSALIMFFYLHSTAQVINKAKAYQNTFMYANLMGGVTREGHIYTVGFVNHYDSIGDSKDIEVLRINLTNGSIISKILPGIYSAASALWTSAKDSTGKTFIGFNSTRHIGTLNFKDSIEWKDYGNGFNASFETGQELAYSTSLGVDGNMYFGASSGRTKVAMYDKQLDTIICYGVTDYSQDYVLSIAGDTSWIYSQVGQNKKIYLYATRKSDSAHFKLDSIGPLSRFDLRCRNDNNVYVGTLNGKFRLEGLSMIPVVSFGGTKFIDYHELGQAGQPKINSSYYNPVTSQYSYVTNTGINATINVPSENILSKIKIVFADRSDSRYIYFFGDYYGEFRRYDNLLDTTIVIGGAFGNVYSVVQMTDSTFGFGCYPSGLTAIWNKNKPYTVGIYDSVTQTVSGLTKTSNPRFVCNMKSTPAQFHHVVGIVYDSVNNLLIGAGNVDRVGAGTSVAVCACGKDSSYGYDYNKIPPSNNFRDIVLHGRDVLLSTSGTNGRIYFYNYLKNVMRDSIIYDGWTGFGKLLPVGALLLGIGDYRYYKINLAKNKELIYDSTVANSLTYYAMMLPDGRIAVNAWEPPPKDFWPYKYLGDLSSMLNYSGYLGSYYSSYGKDITETKNMVERVINLSKPLGREQFVHWKLNNPQ